MTIYKVTKERLDQGLDYILSKFPKSHRLALRKKYEQKEGEHSRPKLLNFCRDLAYAGQCDMTLFGDHELATILGAETFQGEYVKLKGLRNRKGEK